MDKTFKVCEVLRILYGVSTQPIRGLNFFVSVLWTLAIIGTVNGIVVLDIPANLRNEFTGGLVLNAVVIITFIAHYFMSDRSRWVLKICSLLVGSLWQIILANMYVTNYPPMSMMLCTSLVLAFWFLGAVFYTLECEVRYGDTR